MPLLFLGALGCGEITAWILKKHRSFWQMLVSLLLMIFWAMGLLESSWFLGMILLGTMLVLVKSASGSGKSLLYSAGLLVTMTIFLWVGFRDLNFSNKETALGNYLKDQFHAVGWEKAENPLPEGDLSDLGPYRPSQEEALKVTMEQWTPLYIRGYIGSSYKETGWEALDPQELISSGEELYTLQEDYFYPGEQLAAAWDFLERESENAVTIQVLGACRANTYLPYGVGQITEGVLSSENLLTEGAGNLKQEKYSGVLYPVEDSYLLQGQLSEEKESAYGKAEAAYRDWVYDRYLALPETVYEELTGYISVEGEITTVQAKEEICDFLNETLTYEENIWTDAGEKSFSSYVLEVSKKGYSVHYATLAALLLRSMGIPARYVEGYVITPSQAEALEDGESVTLTQRNAHAWTEYYLDGVGWLPFDATPGYQEILEYELPLDGTPAGDSKAVVTTNLSAKEQKNPPARTTDTKEELRQSTQVYIRQILQVLFWLLVIALILWIVRIGSIRRKLRKKIQTWKVEEPKKACREILCYLQELAVTMRIPMKNLDTKEKAENLKHLLKEDSDAENLRILYQEIMFSNHEISQEQKKQALQWLEEARRIWKEKMPWQKRFWYRWICCRIL